MPTFAYRCPNTGQNVQGWHGLNSVCYSRKQQCLYFCLGYPEEPSTVPELEQAGWEERRPPAEFIIRR